MSERVLIFGNLEDVIFIKAAEIKLLQDEISALFEELDDPEDCALYNEHSGCRGCTTQKQCEEAVRTYYAKKEELKKEITKINKEISALHEEKYFHERKLIDKWKESLKEKPNE